MKHFWHLFLGSFVVVLCLAFSANQFELLHKHETNKKSQQIYIDQLGNIFLTQEQNLVKYFRNKKNEDTMTYSQKNIGSHVTIDQSDRLGRMLLFSEQLNAVYYLDKQLNVQQDTINLDDLGHKEVDLVCSSSQGGFWLYDHQAEKLFYYNNNLENIYSSISINSISEGRKKPVYLTEQNKSVYLNIPDYGILVFNHNGAYDKLIPLVNIQQFQIKNNKIVYLNKSRDALIRYNIRQHGSTSMPLPDTTEIIDAKLYNQKLYLLHPKSFSIYTIVQQNKDSKKQ